MLTDEQRAAIRAELKALREDRRRERFFVLLWTDVPDTDDDEYLVTLPDHFRYWGAAEDRGELVGAGPMRPPEGVPETLEGMTVVRVDSFDAARALADASPMAHRKMRTYEIFAWEIGVGRGTVRPAQAPH